MSDRFAVAASMLENATTAEERRMAAMFWLTDAIKAAMARGEAVGPAMVLLGALEGLEFGSVDPMLKLPEGQKVGGKEPPPGETGVDAIALAATQRLIDLKTKQADALQIVASILGYSTGSLRGKRKNVDAERGKPEKERTMYKGLIYDLERERAFMATQSREEVIAGLGRVAKALGINSSPNPLQ